MKRNTLKAFLAFIIIFLMIPFSSGHVPLFEDKPEGIIIDDTGKTTVFYQNFETLDDSQNFIFNMEEGQRLVISIITTEIDTKIKATLIDPEKKEINVLLNDISEAVYEPFAPSYFYELGKYDTKILISGEYLLEVVSKEGGGKIAVASGFQEKFTPLEWVSVPIKSLQIYRWTGQSWAMIITPFILTFLIGFKILGRRSPHKINKLILISGLFYLGGSFSMLMQMLIAVFKTGYTNQIIITLIFILGGALMGMIILSISQKESKDNKSRIKLFIIGALGIIIWSGLLIGPILALIMSFLPPIRKRNI